MNDIMPVGKHFERHDAFRDGLNRAQEYDLNAEYIEWLFRYLNVDVNELNKAVAAALMEWDL
jgi:hypothetical protein